MTGSASWHPEITRHGLFEWKGDTPSDEGDAQVYATSLFLNLVADDEKRTCTAICNELSNRNAKTLHKNW